MLRVGAPLDASNTCARAKPMVATTGTSATCIAEKLHVPIDVQVIPLSRQSVRPCVSPQSACASAVARTDADADAEVSITDAVAACGWARQPYPVATPKN